MLKVVFFYIGVIMTANAKTVLISGFDPFHGGTGNNSTLMGQELEKRFAQANLSNNSDIKVIFCPLRTAFFKASEELKDCINSQEVRPDYVISLGEARCKYVKLETRSKNWMQSYGPDNDGVGFENGRVIDPKADKYLPMTIDLKKLNKKLSFRDRLYTTVSDDAGEFVCNNTAFIMTRDIDIPYAFIHVPGHKCKRQEKLQSRSIRILENLIRSLYK